MNNLPDIKPDQIIRIGDSFDPPKAKILRIYTADEKKYSLCGDIEVIYNQNNSKSVKEDLIWDNDASVWDFKNQGPIGKEIGTLDDYPELK